MNFLDYEIGLPKLWGKVKGIVPEPETDENVSALLTQMVNTGDEALSAEQLASIEDELVDVREGTDGTKYASAGDAVRGQISDLKEDLRQKTGLSEEAKVALLDCFEHVAWIDEHGQTYYENLYDALYPESDLVRLKAVFTQGSAVVYPSTPLADLKTYLTVTGYYNDGTSGRVTDYALSGTLAVGTSTVTVIKNGKTTTFNVTVSQPYWDYEWYANSKTLPTYMTADYYDFTTENGAMFIKKPVLDFEYVGNCRLQIEMKAYSEGAGGVQEFKFCNNPQICILNAVVSANPAQTRGVKIVLDSTLGTSDEHGMTGINVNGTNTLIPNSNSNIYHVYDLTAQDNVYAGNIDGSSIEITQNTDTTPYISRTGISSGTPSEGFYGAFIKSIKFKRL